jgi:hypothetical protein
MTSMGRLAVTFTCLILTVPAWSDAPEISRLRTERRRVGGTSRSPEPSIAGLRFVAHRLLDSEWSRLPGLSPDESAGLQEPVAERPQVVGLIRTLTKPVRFSSANSMTKNADVNAGLTEPLGTRAVWTAAVASEGAAGIRVRFQSVSLSVDSQIYLYTLDGEVHGPYARSDFVNGELWSNTVFSDHAVIEVHYGGEEPQGFEIGQVAHLARPTPYGTECFVDASCASATEFPDQEAADAIGLILIPTSAGIVQCTGTLVTTTLDGDSTPYFVTANHCISTQTEAAFAEVIWHYKTFSCNGAAPDPRGLPRNLGSSLVATSVLTDFTLLRLNQFTPASTLLIGWDARSTVTPPGTLIYSLHHPLSTSQAYSKHVITNQPPGACPTSPQGNFIWSNRLVGGTTSGSSGGPAFIMDSSTGYAYLVGQLLGSCTPDNNNPCVPGSYRMDGSLNRSYPLAAPWLNPQPLSETCTPGPQTACILNNRFKATVRYRGAFDNGSPDTNASVKTVSGFSSSNYETAFFYFNNPNNVEMMLKVLDQGNSNSSGQPTIAVLYGSATPLRLEVTITDTKTGAVKRYSNQFGSQQGGTDFTAFVK